MIVLGTDGGGGPATVTVFVISSVDVTVTAAPWLDPPQAVRKIAAPATTAFFDCIQGAYLFVHGHRRSERWQLAGAHRRLQFDVLGQALGAELASDAGLLEAAERALVSSMYMLMP